MEIWKCIPEHLNYEVSDRGRVREVKSKKILTANNNGRGYFQVRLKTNGRSAYKYTHRLVLMAFIGPPSETKHQCAHLNGNPSDNNVSNLAWVSPKENAFHKIAHKTQPLGPKHLNAKLDEDKVFVIKTVKLSHRKLARMFGITTWTVKDIKNGKTWRHVEVK